MKIYNKSCFLFPLAPTDNHMLNKYTKLIILPLLCIAYLISGCTCCNHENNSAALTNNDKAREHSATMTCTDTGCIGKYVGPEFDYSKPGVKPDDVAHKFSNRAEKVVGKKLKELYKKGKYSQVNFANIKMSTPGLDRKGDVTYELYFPFIRVDNACDAFTSFDHSGGWKHPPELKDRIKDLTGKRSTVLEGDDLCISELKETREGLQEYWIQWRNAKTQSACKGTPMPICNK